MIPSNTLTLHNPAELIHRKEPRQLIRGILYEGISALLYGKSERFKSTLALDMALAVATGTDFLGHKTQQRSVVYIAGEGDGLQPRRLRAALKARDYDTIADAVPLYTIDSAVQIHHQVDELLEQIADRKIENLGLIVIDTLSVCFQGGKPNIDMNPFTSGVDALRRATGAAVVIIHHCGWDAKNPRGDSSLPCNVGLQLRIDRENERAPQILRLKCEKNRHGAHFAPIRFKVVPLEMGVDSDHAPITACVVKPLAASKATADHDNTVVTAKHRAVLAALQALQTRYATAGGIKSGRWHEALIAESEADWRVKMTFYRHRNDLEEWGLITDTGLKGRGPYAITAAGKQELKPAA